MFLGSFLSADCHRSYGYESSTKGMFSSPGFPREYPDNVMCSYFFHASPSGRVQITFDFFSLEKPSDKGYVSMFSYTFQISEQFTQSRAVQEWIQQCLTPLLPDFQSLDLFLFISKSTFEKYKHLSPLKQDSNIINYQYLDPPLLIWITPEEICSLKLIQCKVFMILGLDQVRF